MFTVGIFGFLEKLPFPIKKNIISFKRTLKLEIAKAKLKYDLCDKNTCGAYARQVITLNPKSSIEVCESLVSHGMPLVRDVAVECLLEKTQGQDLVNYWETYSTEYFGKLDRLISSLMRNKNSMELLDKIFSEDKIATHLKIRIAKTLIENGKDVENYKHYLLSLVMFDGPDFDSALAAVAAISNNDKEFIEFHKDIVSNQKRGLATSMKYVAQSQTDWLKKNYIAFYDNFTVKNKIRLLSYLSFVCPKVSLEKWKNWYLEADKFNHKKSLLKSIDLYNFTLTKEDKTEMVNDLKLKPVQAEEVKAWFEEKKDLSQKVCR